MKITPLILSGLAGVCMAASPTQPPPSMPQESAPPRAGICGSLNTFGLGAKFFDCEIIGRVKSIDEIYQKGFRVVSSGFLQKEAGSASPYFYLVIEERKER